MNRFLLFLATLALIAAIAAIGWWARQERGQQTANPSPGKAIPKVESLPKQSAKPSPDQSRAISEIEKLGGRAEVDEESPDNPVVRAFLATEQVTDASLACLEGLAQLEELYLEGTK